MVNQLLSIKEYRSPQELNDEIIETHSFYDNDGDMISEEDIMRYEFKDVTIDIQSIFSFNDEEMQYLLQKDVIQIKPDYAGVWLVTYEEEERAVVMKAVNRLRATNHGYKYL